MAVIFRQRWEGFQILAKHPKAGDQAIATQERSEDRAPRAAHRLCSWGKGRAWHCARRGGIHQSIRQLRPDPWPQSLPAAIAGRAFPGAWNPGDPRSKSLWEGTISEWACGDNFECILLCGALATAERRETSGFAEQIHPTQRQFTSWALWAADVAASALPGLRRCRQ